MEGLEFEVGYSKASEEEEGKKVLTATYQS